MEEKKKMKAALLAMVATLLPLGGRWHKTVWRLLWGPTW